MTNERKYTLILVNQESEVLTKIHIGNYFDEGLNLDKSLAQSHLISEIKEEIDRDINRN